MFHKTLASITLVIFVASLPAAAASTQKYRNEKYGFSMEIPAGWEIEHLSEELASLQLTPMVRFVAPPERDDDEDVIQIVVSLFQLPDPKLLGKRKQMSPKQFADLGIKVAKKEIKGFKLIRSKSMKIYGLPAQVLTSQRNDLIFDRILQEKSAQLVIGNLLVSIDLVTTPKAFARYERVFDRMLKTFTVDRKTDI